MANYIIQEVPSSEKFWKYCEGSVSQAAFGYWLKKWFYEAKRG